MFKNKIILALLTTFAVAFLLFVRSTSSAKAITSIVSTYDFITTDNGMQGLWATDYFHSTVTITPEEKEGCYQVVREDGGTFESLPDAKSPGGAEGTLIGNGTTGTISGGITEIICGVLRETPLSNDTPEDLRNGEYSSYEQKYFHRYFSEIASGNITSWGWTFTTCNNGTWVDNERTEALYNSDGPNPTMGDIKGDFIPCATPAPTPLSCSGDTHPDAAGKNCVSFQLGGAPQGGNGGGQVLGASTSPRVLGAKTMAETGTFTEDLYLAIMTFGGALSLIGLKAFKKIN